jgi:hypothetical protein
MRLECGCPTPESKLTSGVLCLLMIESCLEYSKLGLGVSYFDIATSMPRTPNSLIARCIHPDRFMSAKN